MCFINPQHKYINKVFATAITLIFLINSTIIADADMLSPMVGNPDVYRKIKRMMQARVSAHQKDIDEIIKTRARSSKALSEVPLLETQFNECVRQSGAVTVIRGLEQALSRNKGRIQVIFIKDESELPIFEGKRVWGHAGKYVTVFALENERDTTEGRRRIIGRLFHEIRARSTRARDLFDAGFIREKPNSEPAAQALVERLRDEFEDANMRIEAQIAEAGRILDETLADEFRAMVFADHPNVMNRDLLTGSEAEQAAMPAAVTPALQEDMASYLTRDNISDVIMRLSPIAEEISKETVMLDSEKPFPQTGGLEVDRLNIVRMENGFVVIPVRLKNKWHYLIYRNTGYSLIPKDITAAVADESNWLKESKNLQGIMFGDVEAFLVTKAGAEAIIWTSGFDKEYHAVWTDWDGTVTNVKTQPDQAVGPNKDVLRKLIELHRSGVKVSIGTRRRRSKAEDIRRELIAAGATEKDLNGIYAYFENGAYGIDLGTEEVYIQRDLSAMSRTRIERLLQEQYQGDSKVSKIDTNAGESRIRVILKGNQDLDEYLQRLNYDLLALRGEVDQQLVAVIDSGSSKPQISIMRADVDKTGGLGDLSNRTGIGIARIAKFGDQAHSGQYEVTPGLDRRQFEGNDWPVLRLEGSFGVGTADESSIFPILSHSKNDLGTAEILAKLKFVPKPAPEGGLSAEFQKALVAFHHAWDTTKQRLLRGGSYNSEIEKIKRWVARPFWMHQADRATTLVATHGPAGSGKTTTAHNVLQDLWDHFGIRARIFGIDEWMNQQGRRGKDEKVKYQMDRFIQNLKDLKAGKAIVKPMFDNDTSGNLLFSRTAEGKIVLHNGRRALVIDLDTRTAEEWKSELKTGKLQERVGTLDIDSATGMWSGRCGSTEVEIEFHAGAEEVRVAVAHNDHIIQRHAGQLMLKGPVDTESSVLQEGFAHAIEAQDVVRPGGLIIIEGTRVLNDKSVGGIARDEAFTVQGLFDETIEFKAPFEVRRVRAMRRTESRDMPLSAVDREADEFKNKQEQSEPESLSAGKRARVHIDLQTVPEAVWDKYKSGLASSTAVANEFARLGIDAHRLQGRLDDIAREKIVQVVLDEVAKEGALSYPDKTKDVEARRNRFNNPESPYITLQAGFLEIKIAKSTLASGTASLDDALIAKYEKIRERTRHLMDPGEVVDLSSAGRIFVNLGGTEGMVPLRFGKVLVQNHIPWLEGHLAELAKKGKLDAAKKIVDKFFDTQREMWERGIIDREPDITWRYGRIFLEDEERVVTTSPSSVEIGQAAIDGFNPESYLGERTKERLRGISEELWDYYLAQVRTRILRPLGYKDMSDFSKGDAEKAADLAQAKEVLCANFFEKALPEDRKTHDLKIGAAAAPRTTAIAGNERVFRNIGVSHPYIDAAQLDYVYELTLIPMLKRLREEFMPSRKQGVSALEWARFVLAAQKDDTYNDFYALVKIFCDLLEDNPGLLEETKDNNLLDDLVYSAFERPYLEKGKEAPLIGECTWSVFNFFIDIARDTGKERLEVADPDRIRVLRREAARKQIEEAIDRGEEAVVRIRQGSSPRPMALICDWSRVVKRHVGTVNYRLYNEILGHDQEDAEGRGLDKSEALQGLPIVERVERVRALAVERGLSPKSTDELLQDLERMSVEAIQRLKQEQGVPDWLTPGAQRFVAAARDLLKGKARAFFLFSAKPKAMVEKEAAAAAFTGMEPNNIYSLRSSADDRGYPTRMVPIMKVARSPEVNKIANRLVVIDDTPRGIEEAAVTGALTVGFVGEGTKEERKAKAARLIAAGADVIITSFDQIPMWALLNSMGIRSTEHYLQDGPIYFRRLAGSQGLPSDLGKVWGMPATVVEERLGLELPLEGDKATTPVGTLAFACGLPSNKYTSLAKTPYGDEPFDRLVAEHPQATLGSESPREYPFFMKYLFLKGEPVIWVGIKDGIDIEEVIRELERLASLREEQKRLYAEAIGQEDKERAEAILREYLHTVDQFCDRYFNRIDVTQQDTTIYIPAGVIHAAGTGLSIQLHDPNKRRKEEAWITGPKYADQNGFMVIEPQEVSNLTYQIVLRDLTRKFDEAGFRRGLDILREADGKFPRGTHLVEHLSNYPQEMAQFACEAITLQPRESRVVNGLQNSPQTIFVHKGALTVRDPRDGLERTLESPSALIISRNGTGVRLENRGDKPAVFFRVYLPQVSRSAVLPEAMLFDMDGVLYKSPTNKFDTLSQRLRERYGVEITTQDLRKIEYLDPKWRRRVMEGLMSEGEFMAATNALLRQHGLKTDLNIEEFYELYFEDREPNTQMYAYLQSLKARGVRLGVVSDRLIGDSALMRRRLARDFPGLFEEGLIFFSCDDHATKRTGLISMAIEALQRQGISPRNTAAVDDNPKIIEIANGAGLLGINYVWHDQPAAPEPGAFFEEHLMPANFTPKAIEGRAATAGNGETLTNLPPYMTPEIPGTFGYQDVINMIRYTARITGNKRLAQLSDEVSSGKPIYRPQQYVDGRELNTEEARIAATFDRLLSAHYGKPWCGAGAPSISSFVLNDYIFFLTNLVTGYYQTGNDTYGKVNTPRIGQGAEYLKLQAARADIDSIGRKDALKHLITDILYANRFEGTRELSETPPAVVSDNREELADYLMTLGPAHTIDMFIDNVGPELSASLRFIDYVIKNNIVGKVRIHIKSEPTVVSDVWGKAANPSEPHIIATLDMLEANDNKELSAMAARIRPLIGSRIVLQPDEFLIRRPDFIEVADELNASMPNSSLVMFSGDYLYIKLFGNRKWAHTENMAEVGKILNYINAPVVIVRMIKSYMKMGAPADAPEDNKVGMVQFFAKAAEGRAATVGRGEVETPAVSPRSVQKFEQATLELFAREPGRYRVSADAVAALHQMEGKHKFVVWTSELERRGLPFTADIRSRRELTGTTGETDAIKDIVIITDPRIVKIADTQARQSMIQAYLEKKGLDKVITPQQVICLDSEKDISVRQIHEKLEAVFGRIDIADICIGGIQGEFKYDESVKDYKVLALQQDASTNIGMYKLMTEILSIGDRATKLLQADGERKGWYLYLPPAAPADYQRAYDDYKRYMTRLLSMA